MSDVTTEFVRRHYAQGPTAYRADGSIVRMPTPADVEYAGRQFDRWLAAHDDGVRVEQAIRVEAMASLLFQSGEMTPTGRRMLDKVLYPRPPRKESSNE